MSKRLKTSEQWYQQYKDEWGFTILDPDGWDRQNYDYSFKQEKITLKEFVNRVFFSTTQSEKKSFLESIDHSLLNQD